MGAENHRRFLNHLKESVTGVNVVARWLEGRGHNVRVAPQSTLSGEHKDWKENADDGDIFIIKEFRVEAKRLGYDFTSLNDWPHGDKFIVCAKHSFDRADPKPRFYVYLNRAMTHLAVLETKTYSDWWVERKPDKRYINHDQDCYITHPKNALFQPINGRDQ